MVSKRITDLTELTTPAVSDFVELVDISDTSQNAAGSSFKVQVANLTSAGQSTPLMAASGIQCIGKPGVVGVTWGTRVKAASKWYYEPFEVSAPMTVTAAYTSVSTFGAGLMRIAIYRSDNAWQPTSLVADLGTVDVSTNGVKAITSLTQALTPGLYLAAYNSNIGVTLNGMAGNPRNAIPVPTTNTGSGGVELSVTSTYAAAPTPGVAWNTLGNTGAPAAITHAVFFVWTT